MEQTVQKIPFLRISIALAVGIFLAQYFLLPKLVALVASICILIGLFFLNRQYNYRSTAVFGLGIQLLFGVLGMHLYSQFNQKTTFHVGGVYCATVLEMPFEKPNSYQTTLHITAVLHKDSIVFANEKAIAYFKQDYRVEDLRAGQQILLTAQPQMIENRGNAHEFDYKGFLGRKKIYRQVYVPAEKWKIVEGDDVFSLKTEAEKIRYSLLGIYRSMPFQDRELEILSALILGYKQDLSRDTKAVFTSAGVSHLLAVSGLHVGVVYLLVQFLFGFLRKRRAGRFVFVLLSVLVLWGYAFITGLSPSVMRAAFMITIFVVGDNVGRKSGTYNSLAAAAFFLLLLNSNNLFDVGFQLSFLAVFGIVFLQPKIFNLLHLKQKFWKYCWSLVSVALAAQIATFPLTAYYFSQFPTYFLLSNLFGVPAVFGFIFGGLALLIISKLSVVSFVFALVLNYAIKIVFWLLAAINELPGAVQTVSVGTFHLVLLFGVLFSLLLFLANYKIQNLKAMLLFGLALSLFVLIENVAQRERNQLIVYGQGNEMVVQLVHKRENYIVSSAKKLDLEALQRLTHNTTRALKLEPPKFFSAADSTVNKYFMLQNGTLFFEGQFLLFNQKSINLYQPNGFDVQATQLNTVGQQPVLLTNQRFRGENKIPKQHVHSLLSDGSFIKKW